MKRILFGDDERRVLEQLQQMLKSQKDQWHGLRARRRSCANAAGCVAV
jgi:hypothetical protein